MTDVGESAARAWVEQRLAHGAPVAVMMVGLGRFDLVNAQVGWAAGDAVLDVLEGRILQQAEGARVARLGGSEFLIAGEDRAELVALAPRLVEALAAPADGVAVMARAGLASSGEGDTVATLLRRAGEALIAARLSESGVHVAAPGAASIDRLADDLRRAMAAGEIELRFQPQIAVESGRVSGVEALARWEHPSRGELGADTLFAAADRADLGTALSDHVQDCALKIASGWPEALAALSLSINVTAADIARPGFARAFLAKVAAQGLAPERVTIEVTETGLIENLETAAVMLESLRAGGCRVALDDFGTGYSSLAYLAALPIDSLKLDKSLVKQAAASERGGIVVGGIVSIARRLGLSVVAEGVENEVQRSTLSEAGATHIQGFLYAPPLTSAELIEFIERKNA